MLAEFLTLFWAKVCGRKRKNPRTESTGQINWPFKTGLNIVSISLVEEYLQDNKKSVTLLDMLKKAKNAQH